MIRSDSKLNYDIAVVSPLTLFYRLACFGTLIVTIFLSLPDLPLYAFDCISGLPEKSEILKTSMSDDMQMVAVLYSAAPYSSTSNTNDLLLSAQDRTSRGCRVILSEKGISASFALSPTSASAAVYVASASGESLRIIDIISRNTSTLDANLNSVSVLRFSRSGEYLSAVTDNGKKIRIYRVNAPSAYSIIQARENEIFTHIDFDDLGRMLIVFNDGDDTGAMRLYSIEQDSTAESDYDSKISAQSLWTKILPGAPSAIKLTTSGTLMAIAFEGVKNAKKDHEIGIFNGRSGALISKSTPSTADGRMLDMIWSRDNKHMFTMHFDKKSSKFRIYRLSGKSFNNYIELTANNWAAMYEMALDEETAIERNLEVVSSYVSDAVKLKDNKMSDDAIIGHLFFRANKDFQKGIREGIFGNMVLPEGQAARLKQKGFNDEFISKMEGHPDRVTLGVAGIWLKDTAEIVASPMLRIFVVPKSYYTPRRDLFEPICSTCPNFRLPTGLRYHEKWDINFGYTTSASTKKSDSSSLEKKNYILAGLSYEINPAALFNIGIAFVPGDTKGEKKQLYFGITVDQTFLKQIGLMRP